MIEVIIIAAYILNRAKNMGLPDYIAEYVTAWAVLSYIFSQVFST